ncbi:MAG TPA: YbhB/YbcL family Raf kinase inhibitor-like protein [Abditibacterium sp.]|jgi:Raf kinase inhibitor-like YbhB/YbcL family protein
MKPSSPRHLPLAVLGASGLFSAWAVAQMKSPPITVQGNSTSNTVVVAQLETTPQRIANLKLPAGFTISKFAEMYNPRMIVTRPNGDVYISQREQGTLVLVKDLNKDGKADVQKVVATRKWMHGMAIRDNTMFFMTIRDLYRAPILKDGTLGKITQIANDFPDAGQHPNRTMNFGPDGRLYISVGSTTNAANEPNEENATMIVADRNGRNRRVYASGLRNTIGFGWHPTTKRFIGWDHGIDTLGDDESKEEINEILPNKRYGWPFIYEKGKMIEYPLPPAPYTREDWRKMSQNPRLLHTAHSAGMEMEFYTGNQFPAEYKNDAFVALRGSWNRNPPSGYQIARIRFDKAGNPLEVVPFVTGFLLENPTPKVKWGHFARLAGMAQHADGSLLVSDDTNNIVYRIAYGVKNTPRPLSQLDSRKITFELPETANAPGTIRVVSDTFKNMGGLPLNVTAYGQNISPDLRWSGVPKGTKSLVLMMEDPDAVSPKPFPHWLMVNISPRATGLRKGIPNVEKPGYGAVQGANSTSKIGYFGPRPPADGVKHRYNFQIFALNSKLNLPSGYNRQALLDAMRGKVLAKGKIVGLYERNPF